jgi:3-keto-5-aminohexanoate cleavage enzyme
MKRPVIITCAITGAETTRESQPNLPITPDEQAIAAAEAVQAGASIIHLHVRDDQGKPTQDLKRFKASIDAIRKKCDAIIQISTGGAIGETIENRAKPLELKPEMASLNLGTINFGDDVFYNHPKDIEALAGMMKKQKVMPELEVYEVGMLEGAFRLAKKGIIQEPFHFQFVLGIPGGMSGEPRNLDFLVSILPNKEIHWGVAGVGRYQLPLSTQAIEMGGHVRVGFEDNIYYNKGELAKSNAQLVARVADLAKQKGRSVASVQEARKMLSL